MISDGRLGNQMFQYAFAIATARHFNTGFQLEHVHHTSEVAEWFDIRGTLQSLKPNWFEQWVFDMRNRLLKRAMVEEDLNQFMPTLQNHCIYKGFFQNEKYFAHDAAFIKNFFQLQPKWKAAFEAVKANYDFENSIVVHARLRDYLTWGSDELGGADLSLPASYYANALAALEWKGEPVIVVTDDPKAAQERLSFIPEMTLVHEHLIIDFQVLLHARRLVISNSTFAWWAAWLNPNQPQVMAPKYWLGFKVGKEYPHGITAAAFTPVPVF